MKVIFDREDIERRFADMLLKEGLQVSGEFEWSGEVENPQVLISIEPVVYKQSTPEPEPTPLPAGTLVYGIPGTTTVSNGDGTYRAATQNDLEKDTQFGQQFTQVVNNPGTNKTLFDAVEDLKDFLAKIRENPPQPRPGAESNGHFSSPLPEELIDDARRVQQSHSEVVLGPGADGRGAIIGSRGAKIKEKRKPGPKPKAKEEIKANSFEDISVTRARAEKMRQIEEEIEGEATMIQHPLKASSTKPNKRELRPNESIEFPE